MPLWAKVNGFCREGGAEGVSLRRSLNLHQVAAAGHGDVEVHVGAVVFFVAEVEQKLAIVDDSDADGGNGVAQWEFALERRFCEAYRRPGRGRRRRR